jgi:ABC-type nitrate/sulfonate/bicarbonate transport system permease component
LAALRRGNRIANVAAPIGPLDRFGRWFGGNRQRILPLLSFALVALVWEVSADIGLLNQAFFASPTAIVTAGVRDVQTQLFWGDVRASASEFIVGYGIAVFAGLVFGFTMGWFRRFGYFFRPWIDALNATPSLALMPLVLIWFGLGASSKVAIVFITTFVPVVVNIYTGARTVDQKFLRVAAGFGASRTFLLRSVVVPSIAPFGFAAARLGVGRAVSGVVVGEFFSAQAGLAYRLFQDAQLLQTARLLFGALTITFLALGAFRFVSFAESRTLRWRVTASGMSRLARNA